MDHNRLQDYRENCVLIEAEMYVNYFRAIYSFFFVGGEQQIKSYFEILKLIHKDVDNGPLLLE